MKRARPDGLTLQCHVEESTASGSNAGGDESFLGRVEITLTEIRRPIAIFIDLCEFRFEEEIGHGMGRSIVIRGTFRIVFGKVFESFDVDFGGGESFHGPNLSFRG